MENALQSYQNEILETIIQPVLSVGGHNHLEHCLDSKLSFNMMKNNYNKYYKFTNHLFVLTMMAFLRNYSEVPVLT